MKEINIHQLSDFKFGNATNSMDATGCSVIVAENGATAGVDVRGGGPATRETDLLKSENMVQQIHAVTLSGGSAFGLEASDGVMHYLSEHNIGFDMKGIYIPIVCGASLFDCSVGNVKAYPTKQMGYDACKDAFEHNVIEMGNVGAGTGASVGKMLGFDKAMKTGLGYYAAQLNYLQVGAIVAVNAVGDVFEPNSNTPIAGIYDKEKQTRLFTEDIILNSDMVPSNPIANTTIACIVSNANLSKAQANKLASMAHDAYAHTIRPVHTSNDGDTIFTMCSNKVEADLDVVALMAVKVLEQAIVNACKNAQPAYDLPSFLSPQ